MDDKELVTRLLPLVQDAVIMIAADERGETIASLTERIGDLEELIAALNVEGRVKEGATLDDLVKFIWTYVDDLGRERQHGDRPIEPDEVTGAAEAPDRALAWLRERCG